MKSSIEFQEQFMNIGQKRDHSNIAAETSAAVQGALGTPRLKIADFGLSRAFSLTPRDFTREASQPASQPASQLAAQLLQPSNVGTRCIRGFVEKTEKGHISRFQPRNLEGIWKENNDSWPGWDQAEICPRKV